MDWLMWYAGAGLAFAIFMAWVLGTDGSHDALPWPAAAACALTVGALWPLALLLVVLMAVFRLARKHRDAAAR